MFQRLLLLSAPLLLWGCSSQTAGPATISLQDRLQNPLYAERYWSEMVDRLTMLQIRADPVLQDAKKAATVDDVKRDALEQSQAASKRIRDGISADFVSVGELVEGSALLVDGMLYFSSNFESYPGPTLRVYLTEAVDPRNSAFPDPTSIDLGILQNPYGAQEYVIPEDKLNPKFRTVVLWERRIGRLYAFAQLAK